MKQARQTEKRLIAGILSAVCAAAAFGTVPSAAAADEADKLAAYTVSYQDSAALTAKVSETWEGNLNLYLDSACTKPALLTAETGMNNKQCYYIQYINEKGNKAADYGWQCYAYAQGAFSYVCGELAGHGVEKNYQHCVVPLKNKSSVSYAMFVKHHIMPLSYVRTTANADGSYNGSNGHSLLILSYDANSVTIQEGNALGHGEIRTATMTWDKFNYSYLSRKNRVLSHIVQPTDAYYQEQFGLSYDFDGTAAKLTKYEKKDVLINRLGSGFALAELGGKENWKSANTDVITVDTKGNLTVLKNGNVTITAEDGFTQYTYRISVDAPTWEALGDVDGDKIVTPDDATIVLRYYAENMLGEQKTELTPVQQMIADVDNNDVINSDDASLLLQFYTEQSLFDNSTNAENIWNQLTA